MLAFGLQLLKKGFLSLIILPKQIITFDLQFKLKQRLTKIYQDFVSIEYFDRLFPPRAWDSFPTQEKCLIS